MKERPILMSAPMVRAILAGTKTQTRRVVKLHHGAHTLFQFACPYGMPGDRLWVREAWRVAGHKDDMKPRDLKPRAMTVFMEAGGSIANEGDPPQWRDDEWPRAPADRPDWVGKLRPAIFMPRWASRIVLEVTDVRVERLQDISEADAAAEGVEPLDSDRDDQVFDRALCKQCGGTGLFTSFGHSGGAKPDTDCGQCDTHAKRYRWLWDSLNGAGSWDANPFVWVVSFKRISSEGVTE